MHQIRHNLRLDKLAKACFVKALSAALLALMLFVSTPLSASVTQVPLETGSAAVYQAPLSFNEETLKISMMLPNLKAYDWVSHNYNLARVFGSTKLVYRAGDIFKTVDEAALAWAFTYYAISNSKINPREYASAIYVNGSGYSFSSPNVGSRDSVRVPNAPSGYTMVAAIHSHPELPGYDYNNFSKYDQFGNYAGDYAWVNSSGLPLYVVTPSGDIKIAELNSRRQITERTVFSGIKF